MCSIQSIRLPLINCQSWDSANVIPEEVILAEERTTEEEKMHIMEGNFRKDP